MRPRLESSAEVLAEVIEVARRPITKLIPALTLVRVLLEEAMRWAYVDEDQDVGRTAFGDASDPTKAPRRPAREDALAPIDRVCVQSPHELRSRAPISAAYLLRTRSNAVRPLVWSHPNRMPSLPDVARGTCRAVSAAVSLDAVLLQERAGANQRSRVIDERSDGASHTLTPV
jgi:hypothetical protein